MDLRLRSAYQLLIVFISAAILAACGGSSNNVVIPVAGTPLFTTALSTINLAPGAKTTFTVGGGGGKASFTSYSVFSSDTTVATVVLSGTSFVIGGVAPGSADITISDSAGASVTIKVTISGATITAGAGALPPIPLYTVAPANVTVGVGTVTRFGVAGGTGPYTVTSGNAMVAQASLTTNLLTVAGVSEGSTSISVVDAQGTSIAVNVAVILGAVRVPLQTTAASATTLALCTPSINTISGGTAPYRATSTDLDIATPIIAGSLLSIMGTAPGQATIVLSDATGASVQIAGTVAGASAALCTTASASNTLAVNGSSSFRIGGGTPPYTVTPSNSNAMSAVVTGATLTISGKAAGTEQITVKDATGASAPVFYVTVVGGATTLYSAAPDTITVARGALAKFIVDGGVAPYAVASSNVLIAAADLSGNDVSISGGSVGGDATVVIHDATGALISITVKVP